jgi:hypothetical protein
MQIDVKKINNLAESYSCLQGTIPLPLMSPRLLAPPTPKTSPLPQAGASYSNATLLCCPPLLRWLRRRLPGAAARQVSHVQRTIHCLSSPPSIPQSLTTSVDVNLSFLLPATQRGFRELPAQTHLTFSSFSRGTASEKFLRAFLRGHRREL